MKYKEWQKGLVRFLSMISYTVNFELLYHFEDAYNEYLGKYTMTGLHRNIQYSYPNALLSDFRVYFVFIPCYLKNSPTQEMLADIFGIERHQCCRFMYGSQLLFRYWFVVIHLLTSTKKSFSASELQRQLGYKNYDPIWAMLHKLRQVMGNRDARYSLKGIVELDGGYFSTEIYEFN
jgi:hypothetical protein